MNPHVLLAPRITDDSVAMWRCAVARGWPVTRIQGWRVPENLIPTGQPVIIYGEPLFAEAVADQLERVLLEPSLDWLVHLPEKYRQRKIAMLTLAEARECVDRAFVKPADGKIFEPRVYAHGGELPGEDQVDGSILVLRSGIMDFRLEVRSFIHQRRLVTLSPYWREDALAQDAESGSWPFLGSEEEEAKAFVEKVLADPEMVLPPACTLDIGRDAIRGWAVIEANPAWGAGLYGCDPDAVLEILSSAIIPRGELNADDFQWVSPRRRAALG